MLESVVSDRSLGFMKPKVVKRFEYRGKKIRIKDLGEDALIVRYGYTIGSRFADLGGDTIDEAMQEAKRHIDNVEGMHGAY